jgi:hypothetical protein
MCKNPAYSQSLRNRNHKTKPSKLQPALKEPKSPNPTETNDNHQQLEQNQATHFDTRNDESKLSHLLPFADSLEKTKQEEKVRQLTKLAAKLDMLENGKKRE